MDMLNVVTKDTSEAGCKFFAVMDIEAKAEAAVRDNPQLEAPEHLAIVARVEELGRKYYAGFNAIYSTARLATRNRPAHTEVKFSRVVNRASKNRAAERERFYNELQQAGVKQIICKPATESYSFLVW